jgi:hypothetical protein
MENQLGRQLYNITIFILILVFFFLFRNESTIIDKISNYTNLIIILIGFIYLLYRKLYNKTNYFSYDLKILNTFWIITSLWMFLVPFLFFNYNYSVSNLYDGMVQDYRYVLFYYFAFIFASSSMELYYAKLFKVIGYASLISGIFSLLLVDKSFTSISNREGAWSIPYYLWWVLYCGVGYWFLKSFFEGKTKIGYYLIILYLIISLFFLKRSGIVNILILVSLGFIFHNDKRRSLIFLSVLSLLIFIVIIYFSDLFNLIFARFDDTAGNLDEWDRNLEIDEFFDKTTRFQLTTGFGINNYLKMNYIGQSDIPLNSLHIGFYNIFYKGGVLYFLFTITLFVFIVKLWKYIHKDVEIKIGFVLGILFIMVHSYEGGWSYFPEHFFTLLPIFRAINLASIYKNKKSFYV